MNRRLALRVAATLFFTAGACTSKGQRQADLDVAQRLFNQQKYEASIAVLERILEDEPNDWVAHYRIALGYTALYHTGSTDPRDQEYARKATAECELLLQMTPPADRPDEKKNVAELYVDLLNASEQHDKAIHYYETLRAQAPDDLNAIEMLAKLYYTSKREFEPAMELYERLTELDSRNKDRWYTVGQLYWTRAYNGNKPGAIAVEERQYCIKRGMAALDEALKINPDYMEALAVYDLLWREQSQVLRQLGDDIGADAALKRAQELEVRARSLRDQRKAGR